MSQKKSKRYDVFISYSSKDSKEVKKIQNFLENYKFPSSFQKDLKDKRIRAFRDKSDQGVSHDYLASFEEYIHSIPNFLIVCSNNSVNSEPVNNECTSFVETQKESLNIALIEGDKESVIPSVIKSNVPRAIFADLRVLKNSNILKWIFVDRYYFKNEMLRLVSSILSEKFGNELNYEDLKLRDRQRSRYYTILTTILITIFFLLITVRIFNSPTHAWHQSKHISNATSIEVPEHISESSSFYIIKEEPEPWSDDAGHEGEDLSVEITELSEDDQILGKLEFSLTDTSELIGNNSVDKSGTFERLSEDRIYEIVGQFGESHQNWKSINFNLPDSLMEKDHFESFEYQYDEIKGFQIRGYISGPPFPVFFTDDGGLNWNKTDEIYFSTDIRAWHGNKANGVTFIWASERFDPFDPLPGGLARTTDFGKSWELVPEINIEATWNSLNYLGWNHYNSNEIVVSIGENETRRISGRIVNEFYSSGIWLTKDFGSTWTKIDKNRSGVDNMLITNSGNVISLFKLPGEISSKVFIYRKRSILDRLLNKHDLPQ